MLDFLFRLLASTSRYWEESRESECLEFTDPTDGKHYEIVVREIDERS